MYEAQITSKPSCFVLVNAANLWVQSLILYEIHIGKFFKYNLIETISLFWSRTNEPEMANGWSSYQHIKLPTTVFMWHIGVNKSKTDAATVIDQHTTKFLITVLGTLSLLPLIYDQFSYPGTAPELISGSIFSSWLSVQFFAILPGPSRCLADVLPCSSSRRFRVWIISTLG